MVEVSQVLVLEDPEVQEMLGRVETLRQLPVLMAAAAAAAAPEIRILAVYYHLPVAAQVLAEFLQVLEVYPQVLLLLLHVEVVMVEVVQEVLLVIIMVQMVIMVYQEPMVQMLLWDLQELPARSLHLGLRR